MFNGMTFKEFLMKSMLSDIEDELDLEAIDEFYDNKNSQDYQTNDWDDALEDIGI